MISRSTAIKEIAAGGHFFGSAHTLARYESAFYRPLLSDWSNFENWTDAGARNATERATGIWKKLLAGYVPPPLDPAVKEAIDAYVARRTREIDAALTQAAARACGGRLPQVRRTRERADHERAHVRGDPGGRGGLARAPRARDARRGRRARLLALSRAAAARGPVGARRISARCSCAAIPIALELAKVVADRRPDPARPLGRRPAALPHRPHRARGRALRTLEDTFGGRAGWTVEHSHSGFNAFRHHLLAYRTPAAAGAVRADDRQPRDRPQRSRQRARRAHRHRAARCLLAPADRPPRAAS